MELISGTSSVTSRWDKAFCINRFRRTWLQVSHWRLLWGGNSSHYRGSLWSWLRLDIPHWLLRSDISHRLLWLHVSDRLWLWLNISNRLWLRLDIFNRLLNHRLWWLVGLGSLGYHRSFSFRLLLWFFVWVFDSILQTLFFA